MAKNRKDTKYTIHISRIMHFVRNGEEWKLHKIVWCEGGLKLEDILTKNVRENELNPRLGYAMVRIENLQKNCTIVVIGDRIVWRTIWSEWLDWI